MCLCAFLSWRVEGKGLSMNAQARRYTPTVTRIHTNTVTHSLTITDALAHSLTHSLTISDALARSLTHSNEIANKQKTRDMT